MSTASPSPGKGLKKERGQNKTASLWLYIVNVPQNGGVRIGHKFSLVPPKWGSAMVKTVIHSPKLGDVEGVALLQNGGRKIDNR